MDFFVFNLVSFLVSSNHETFIKECLVSLVFGGGYRRVSRYYIPYPWSGGEGVYSIFMHGCSRMTIAISSYITLAFLLCRNGPHRVFINQRQTLLASSAKHREVFGESHEG